MSPLTKIFVVLLVVTSMLLSAATVVFVNKFKPLQLQLDAANVEVQTRKAEAASAKAGQAKAEDGINKAIVDGQAGVKAASATIAVLESQISALTAQVATLNADKASRDGQISSLNTQLQWAVAAETKFADQVKQLRETNDKMAKQQEDDSRKIAELTALSETLKSQLELSTEQLALAKTENQTLRKYLIGINVDVAKLLGEGVVPTGNAQGPISGLVTEKQNINGNTYVTINVGSVDTVQVGTEFSILHQGQFLGFVKVEHVDNNLSTGKFNGKPDKVTQLQAGDEAKTQIRGS